MIHTDLRIPLTYKFPDNLFPHRVAVMHIYLKQQQVHAEILTRFSDLIARFSTVPQFIPFIKKSFLKIMTKNYKETKNTKHYRQSTPNAIYWIQFGTTKRTGSQK